MVYYEITIQSTFPFAYDILMAALAEIGFDSFTEEDGLLKAYVSSELFNEQEIRKLFLEYEESFPFGFEIKEIPHQNWNEIWESNFQPITVGNELRVRAVFHEPDPDYKLELIIQPKMSFGTGHHATTWLVMNEMLQMDFSGKKVMDFGTGTGILAILAQKLGAAEVWAVDYDPQCVENAAENFELNGTKNIHLALGNITAFSGISYDIVIGNITRNVILEFLSDIAKSLANNGLFIASGFYEEDLEILKQHAEPLGLRFQKSNTKDKWCTAIFMKK